MQKKDTLFSDGAHPEGSFIFNKDVVTVFDNMANRSIPLYEETLHLIVQHIKNHSNIHRIYDLGCSTGNLIHNIASTLPHRSLHITGLDQSNEMLKKAKKKSSSTPNHTLEWIPHNLNTPLTLAPNDITILHLTLQFIPIENRLPRLKEIYSALNTNGTLLLFEKIKSNHTPTQILHETIHSAHKKRNGYSDTEINNKKEALKNVLIPLTIEDNRTLLKNAGFSNSTTFFQWHNFCGIIGFK